MKAVPFIVALGLSATISLAQSPSPVQPPAGTHYTDLGLTYSVAGDWEVLSAPVTMDQEKSEASQNATDVEKKGLACLEPVFTARGVLTSTRPCSYSFLFSATVRSEGAGGFTGTAAD